MTFGLSFNWNESTRVLSGPVEPFGRDDLAFRRGAKEAGLRFAPIKLFHRVGKRCR